MFVRKEGVPWSTFQPALCRMSQDWSVLIKWSRWFSSLKWFLEGNIYKVSDVSHWAFIMICFAVLIGGRCKSVLHVTTDLELKVMGLKVLVCWLFCYFCCSFCFGWVLSIGMSLTKLIEEPEHYMYYVVT